MIRQFTNLIRGQLSRTHPRGLLSSFVDVETPSKVSSSGGHYSMQRLHHDPYNDFTINKLTILPQTTIYGCYRHHWVTLQTVTGKVSVERLTNEMDFPGSGEEFLLSGEHEASESVLQIRKNSPFYVRTGETESVAIMLIRPSISGEKKMYIDYETSGTHTFL